MKFLHVRLKVRDMERSINFYRDNFGFELRTQKTSPRGTQLTFLKLADCPVEIELAYLPWDPDFKLDEDIFHLAFEVPNMQQAFDEMTARGVKFTEMPMTMSSGSQMAFIEDPDGYEIELLEYPERI